jgi:hypothetical protein
MTQVVETWANMPTRGRVAMVLAAIVYFGLKAWFLWALWHGEFDVPDPFE